MSHRLVRFACAATLALVGTAAAFVATSTAVHAQTVTYKGDVKLPTRLQGIIIRAINDSGLNATDLDVTYDPNAPTSVYYASTKSRVLMSSRRGYTMFNDANGKPYFQQTVNWVNLKTDGLNERHNDITGGIYGPGTIPYLIGHYALGTYQTLTSVGDNLGSAVFTLPNVEKAVSHGGVYGGKTTTIFATSFGGLRLYSLDAEPAGLRYPTPTMIIPGDTPSADLALSGSRLAQTFGTDGNLYVLDPTGKRVMTFDLGLNGGTRGTLLNSFLLDPEKAADNSLTMDFGGNLYVGDGAGGFNMYSKEGQFKMGFADFYAPDPNIGTGTITPYMNFYASGLNDGGGTLDIYDVTGYRQYSVVGAAAAVVPEANTFALALPALGMVGAVVIRRRKK